MVTSVLKKNFSKLCTIPTHILCTCPVHFNLTKKNLFLYFLYCLEVIDFPWHHSIKGSPHLVRKNGCMTSLSVDIRAKSGRLLKI